MDDSARHALRARTTKELHRLRTTYPEEFSSAVGAFQQRVEHEWQACIERMQERLDENCILIKIAFARDANPGEMDAPSSLEVHPDASPRRFSCAGLPVGIQPNWVADAYAKLGYFDRSVRDRIFKYAGIPPVVGLNAKIKGIDISNLTEVEVVAIHNSMGARPTGRSVEDELLALTVAEPPDRSLIEKRVSEAEMHDLLHENGSAVRTKQEFWALVLHASLWLDPELSPGSVRLSGAADWQGRRPMVAFAYCDFDAEERLMRMTEWAIREFERSAPDLFPGRGGQPEVRPADTGSGERRPREDAQVIQLPVPREDHGAPSSVGRPSRTTRRSGAELQSIMVQAIKYRDDHPTLSDRQIAAHFNLDPAQLSRNKIWRAKKQQDSAEASQLRGSAVRDPRTGRQEWCRSRDEDVPDED